MITFAAVWLGGMMFAAMISGMFGEDFGLLKILLWPVSLAYRLGRGLRDLFLY